MKNQVQNENEIRNYLLFSELSCDILPLSVIATVTVSYQKSISTM